MKIIIPTMIAVLTFSVGAQEAARPATPQKKEKTSTAVDTLTQAKVQEAIAAAKAKAASTQKEKAATRTSRRRVVLPSKNSRSSRAATRAGGRPASKVASAAVSVAPEKPKVLTENITIQLQGSVYGVDPLDLSLTGVGPIFQADVVTGEDHSILSHQYSVKPHDGGYRVEYSIGLRIKMVASRNGQNTNYEYRDVVVTGTALAKEGKRVVISKNGAHELGLTLSKAAKK